MSTTASPAAPPPPARLLAAGDIASCESEGDEQTAALLDALPGTIVALGDLAYDRGRPEEFVQCYAPSWGRHRDRTIAAPGNHDYGTPDAAGFRDYFGLGAGPMWRAHDVGSWRVLTLDTNCGIVACGAGSEQHTFVQSELVAADAAGRCVAAAMHHPRRSSGPHQGYAGVEPLWRLLVDGGADVVLAGHDHIYERFAVEGTARLFVVGTGGFGRYPIRAVATGSEVRHNGSWGVLELTLRDGSYAWAFRQAPGSAEPFSDAGDEPCR